MRFVCVFLLLCACLSGCYQTSSNGEDFRTVPVTNNPNVVPDTGFGPPTAMPY